jgi:hypothetical protein
MVSVAGNLMMRGSIYGTKGDLGFVAKPNMKIALELER